MIPLSRWLAERQAPVTVHAVPDDLEEPIHPLPDPLAAMDSQERHDAVRREEELRAMLRAVEERLEQQLLTQAAREREIETSLGEELRLKLQSEIARAMETLLEMIEESLASTLAPFLEEQARKKAVEELTVLVRQELQLTEAPVLEIRAPARLQDALYSLGDEIGISVTATESSVVELVFATERRRFEDLSSRWLQAIKGHAP